MLYYFNHSFFESIKNFEMNAICNNIKVKRLLSLNHSAKSEEPTLLEIHTHPLAFTLLTGDSLRVDIASSVSEFVPYPNIKGHWAEVESSMPCRNTMYFGESHIMLYPD